MRNHGVGHSPDTNVYMARNKHNLTHEPDYPLVRYSCGRYIHLCRVCKTAEREWRVKEYTVVYAGYTWFLDSRGLYSLSTNWLFPVAIDVFLTMAY